MLTENLNSTSQKLQKQNIECLTRNNQETYQRGAWYGLHHPWLFKGMAL